STRAGSRGSRTSASASIQRHQISNASDRKQRSNTSSGFGATGGVKRTVKDARCERQSGSSPTHGGRTWVSRSHGRRKFLQRSRAPDEKSRLSLSGTIP